MSQLVIEVKNDIVAEALIKALNAKFGVLSSRVGQWNTMLIVVDGVEPTPLAVMQIWADGFVQGAQAL